MTQIFNLHTKNLIILAPIDQERVKWKKYKPHSPWCEWTSRAFKNLNKFSITDKKREKRKKEKKRRHLTKNLKIWNGTLLYR
jgi:hypothetical protein